MNDNIKNNQINTIYDLIIIGAGPAGLTAALYAQRASLKTLVVEKYLVGGKMTKTSEIENYPGYQFITGPELSEIMQKQVDNLNVPFLFDEVQSITTEKATKLQMIKLASSDENNSNQILKTKTVIIATGCVERKLNIPGENEYENRGVSYCAVCDGFLYKNQTVAVVGGGYAALEESLFLTRMTDDVHLIHRREQFRADDNTLNRVKENNKIKMHLNTVVTEVTGNQDQTKVASIKIKNVVNNETKSLTVGALFPYIGSDPITKFVSDLSICDEQGYIVVDNQCETKVKGIFAAGDVVAKKLRQIVTATNDGAIAAQYAINYIEEHFKI